MPKLLVVDDEQNIRAMIRKYAEFDGYAVEEAGDGMEAVEKFRKGAFDLIIMDVMMPELDGFSACREIRKTAERPGAHALRPGGGIRQDPRLRAGGGRLCGQALLPQGADDAGERRAEAELQASQADPCAGGL